MNTYHEQTGKLIENPDLEAGCVYPGQRYVGTERVILKGTVALYPPNGLGHDKPVFESCQWYHPWTEQELAAKNEKTVDEKISDAVTAAVALAQGGAV